MSAGPPPCQWTEIDRRPENLPSSRGLGTDSSGPPGPHLMSHAVDTFSALTRSRLFFLFAHLTFITLSFFHGRSHVCGRQRQVHACTCASAVSRIHFYIVGAAACMFQPLSGHVKCHNTDMSAASVTAEQRRGSCKAFLDGL